MEPHYLIHTDGGARGNPGPAAIGVILEGLDIGRKEYGEYLGETTNNVAEYAAVIFALKKLKSLVGSERASQSSVLVHADSELLVRQLNGKYKIKEAGIQDLFLQVWNLRLDFGQVTFAHVSREKNSRADRMVNQTLDKEANKLDL